MDLDLETELDNNKQMLTIATIVLTACCVVSSPLGLE